MQNTTTFDYQKSIFEILNISELGLVILDENRKVRWCNGEFANWINAEPDALLDRDWLSLPLEPGDEHDQIYHLICKKRNQTLHLEHWHAMMPSYPELTVHYFRAVSLDKNRATSPAALVNIPKRPNWVQFLDYEVSRSRRYNNPLAVLKVKLLMFENDQLLHVTGDINEAVSQLLKDELRWADMIGHSQAGEFLVVLPETNEAACQALQHKIAQTMEEKIIKPYPNYEFELVFGEAYWQKGDSSGLLLDRVRDDLLQKMQGLAHQLS